MSESFVEAHRRLAAAQKGHARGAPAYSVYLNRRLGRVLAAAAFRWGWTPNQVTAVSAAHTFVGIALLLALPVQWWSGVIVALLLVLGYAWDSADGQVARLRGGGSLAGEWLDHFVDAIKIASTFVADLGRDRDSDAICSAIVELAHSLGLCAIAEGVETLEQFAALRALDCELAQGHLFGPARPAEDYGAAPAATLGVVSSSDGITPPR